ncbi:TolC family protein [Herbaspirillum sp. RTI4]|uniref:TolC family protein n=1 Tax=Herbaspirillum sp. RTI4 TaxID=3048640 RepID=UPI002AB4F425|nr:TolC family protein [Herbaspirillum sp. RTI4]MDY7579283.1 TolC family protein [Herbaspirillum sp. RTI4]MEA9982782.1 TolC family protein [Herbaspirillum sp. RTI4]
MRLNPFVVPLATSIFLAACATQAPYSPPQPPAPSGWENNPHPGGTGEPVATGQWWTRLNDAAISELVNASFADNPTLAQALARVDQARAAAGLAAAQKMPGLTGNLNAGRAQVQNTAGIGNSTTLLESSAAAGLSLNWEIDLWGRIRESNTAAQRRLEARNADAQGARLSLAAQVASTGIVLRACYFSLQVRDADIASRETELLLTRKRRAVGYIAPAAEFSAQTNLANARTARISQQEQCTRSVDALVALTGKPAFDIRSLLQPAASSATSNQTNNDLNKLTGDIVPDQSAQIMPTPPTMQAALPATVLIEHPSLVAAERSLAAAWSDIGVARAQRLPTVNLSSVLTGQWLHAAGTSLALDTWSVGAAAVNIPLFDGGAGAANVDAATARYREAAASFQATLRSVVQNVEDALAAQTSAEQRLQSSQDAVDAAHLSFRASQAQWRAGAISIFELEQVRRQRQTAEENLITAQRDQVQAWISLMQATGQIDHPA